MEVTTVGDADLKTSRRCRPSSPKVNTIAIDWLDVRMSRVLH